MKILSAVPKKEKPFLVPEAAYKVRVGDSEYNQPYGIDVAQHSIS